MIRLTLLLEEIERDPMCLKANDRVLFSTAIF